MDSYSVPTGESGDAQSITSYNTYDTENSKSSVSTVWGPGTLSGRAIRSLGEASLRGFEKILIRRRLAKISSTLESSLPRARAPATPDKMERMYDDLLEISRLDYYDGNVRQKALRLIVMQIASKETNQLVACITKWPLEEIRIFLAEIVACMSYLWYDEQPSQSGAAKPKQQLDVLTMYRAAILSQEHESIPFLQYIMELCLSSPTARRAVLEAGILEFLRILCTHCGAEDTPGAIHLVRDLMTLFLADPQGLYPACRPYRMTIAWPRDKSFVPLSASSASLLLVTATARTDILLRWPKVALLERLCEIQVVLSLPQYHVPACESDLFDLAQDLVESAVRAPDGDIAHQAFDLLLHCIAVGGEVWRNLRNVLILSPYETNLDIFYRIVYPLLNPRSEKFPTVVKLTNLLQKEGPAQNVVEYILSLAAELGQESPLCARALKDADILSLVKHCHPNSDMRWDFVFRLKQSIETEDSALDR